MTQPAPIDPETAALDQAVITAGYELARAELERPRDPKRVTEARARLIAASQARWPNA